MKNWLFKLVVVLAVAMASLANAEAITGSMGQAKGVNGDSIPPTAISDLKAEPGRTAGEISLSFTAPGNDGNFAGKGLNGAYYIQYAKRDDISWAKDKAQIRRPISNVNYGHKDKLVAALIGDPQYYHDPPNDTNIYSHFASLDNAISTFDDLKDVPHDFLVVLGDLVWPHPNFWYYHHEYTVKMATRPLYLISGNAEFYLADTAGNFTKQTGLSLDPYKVVNRGIRFIFLHTTGVKTGKGQRPGDHHQCQMGEKAMDWLKKELASDTKSTTIVFFHAPIFNTTYDSGGLIGERHRMVESEEMRALFEKYPDVKVFANGHLHYHNYGEIDSEGRGQYKLEGNVLHITVGQPPNTLFLIIEKEKIYTLLRNNKTKEWYAKYGYTYNVETTLQPKKPDHQNIDIGGLEPDCKYYFKIWTEDEAGNCSKTSGLAYSLS